MNIKQDLIEIGKEKLNQVKIFMEELEVQMALGKAEARDTFEKEKKSFSKFISEVKAEAGKEKLVAEKHRHELLLKFEALEAKLSVETPTKKREFNKMKAETLQAIYELEHIIKEAWSDVNSEVQLKLDKFKAILDTYRVQLALGNIDNKEAFESRKQELMEAADEIRLKLQKEEASKDKFEVFVEEVSESFDRFKNAFTDLFS